MPGVSACENVDVVVLCNCLDDQMLAESSALQAGDTYWTVPQG